MSKLLLATGLILLSGCAFQGKAVMEPGQQYGYGFNACQPIPEIVNKVKEGLGDMKVCVVAEAGILVLPKDVEIK